MDKIACRCGEQYYRAQAWIHAFCEHGKRVMPTKEQREAAYARNRRHGEREMLEDIARMRNKCVTALQDEIVTPDVTDVTRSHVTDAHVGESVTIVTPFVTDVVTPNVTQSRADYMREYRKRKASGI